MGMIFVTPPEDSHRRSLGIRELYMTHSKENDLYKSLGFRGGHSVQALAAARVLAALGCWSSCAVDGRKDHLL